MELKNCSGRSYCLVIFGFGVWLLFLAGTSAQAADNSSTTVVPTSAVTIDPNATTAATNISSTTPANTTISATTSTTTSATTSTTTSPTTSTTVSTTITTPNGTANGTAATIETGSTTAPTTPATVITPNTTTTTTQAPASHDKSQKFSAASFIGGFVLCAGLVAIAGFGYKFYKSRQERNYHTL